MRLDELEIFEDDFDLFVALDDTEKIEFLFDATQNGVEAAVLKQVTNLSDRYQSKIPLVASEDYIVGTHRLCITTFPDKVHINSSSLKAIKRLVAKLFNDGVLLFRTNTKKSDFDIYRYFRSYKVIGRVGPFCNN